MKTMSLSPDQDQSQCPNCGANLRDDDTLCPACGAPVSRTDSAAQRREEVLKLIADVNQDLVQAGSGAAESAFGLGCSLGTISGVVLLVAIFLLGSRNWVLLGIVAMGVTIVAVGVSVFVSARAKSATIEGSYQRQVKPKIEKNLPTHRFTRQEFDALADEILAQDAPLKRYLSLPDKRDLAASEN